MKDCANSTVSQNTEPSSNANNPMDSVSQSSNSATTSQASASSTRGTPTGDSQSVVKQIIIDEKDVYKVTGISFIILLILLTIGYYYKEDIKEMKSKL